jgi:site-specific recombinase XerD
MLNERVQKEELKAAGRIDPFEEEAKRPIGEHIDQFEGHLQHKGNTAQHVYEVAAKVRKIVKGRKWKAIRDISASQTQACLAALRNDEGLSVQTSNHYLRAIKQFTRWMVRDRRMRDDPLVHLAMLNTSTDRRHDRRALAPDEFARLVAAAQAGKSVVCMPGPDRAMMYVLAAWTGYRKGEIGSLTARSLRLDEEPPTVTVEAAYSKRRRQDTQVLHPDVAQRLRTWMTSKGHLRPNQLLFPVSGKVPGGTDRRTSKMMKSDLAAARKIWIKEAKTADEREAREKTDFLSYRNEDGLFADFHSNRHLFITNLCRAGISPKTAQTLARHCDIRLTMNVYTHIGLGDQTSAIGMLPAPPSIAGNEDQWRAG